MSGLIRSALVGSMAFSAQLRPVLIAAITILLIQPAPFARSADKPALADWIEKLKDKHKEVRLRAIKAIGDVGTPAKVAAPDLVDGLQDKDIEIEAESARTLARIGPSGVPVLRQALGNEQARVRGWATNALGLLAPDSKAAAEALMEAAKDRDAGVRSAALKGLIGSTLASEDLEAIFQAASKDAHPYVSMLGAARLEMLKSADGQKDVPVIAAPVFALQRLTPDQEAQLDKMLEAFINYDIRNEHEQLTPAQRVIAMQLSSCLNQLGPESIAVLVRGLNKAAIVGFDCPYSSIDGVLRAAIANCNDPRQIDYALENIGRGLPPRVRARDAISS